MRPRWGRSTASSNLTQSRLARLTFRHVVSIRDHDTWAAINNIRYTDAVDAERRRCVFVQPARDYSGGLIVPFTCQSFIVSRTAILPYSAHFYSNMDFIDAHNSLARAGARGHGRPRDLLRERRATPNPRLHGSRVRLNG